MYAYIGFRVGGFHVSLGKGMVVGLDMAHRQGEREEHSCKLQTLNPSPFYSRKAVPGFRV